MEGILLHVLYRGEKANDFASEMERSGLRAAVLAEEGYSMTTTSLSPRKSACCSWSTGVTAPRSTSTPRASRWQSSRRSRQATTSQRPLSALNEEKRIPLGRRLERRNAQIKQKGESC